MRRTVPPGSATDPAPHRSPRTTPPREVLERIPTTGKRLYQFTAIDDCARIRILKVYDACNQRTAVQFLNEVFRRLPFRIHVLQTDNDAEFQSQFHWHAESLDIRHVYIRSRMPHLNGKVERSHRVDDQEFYQLLDRGRHRRHPPVQRQTARVGGLLQLRAPARGPWMAKPRTNA
jgi:hypothetical protein